MQTFGFSCGFSGEVTLDVALPVPSTYIFLPSTATQGGIVYKNTAGQLQWWPYAVLGYNPIAATMIVTSGTVDGMSRTTTATPMGWAGSVYS